MLVSLCCLLFVRVGASACAAFSACLLLRCIAGLCNGGVHDSLGELRSRDPSRGRELAATMGIRGTPSLIVGEQLVPGAIDYGQLTALIEQEKTNCKVC